jgi:hypothetical protein
MVQYKIINGAKPGVAGGPVQTVELQINELAKDGWRAISLAIDAGFNQHVLLSKHVEGS